MDNISNEQSLMEHNKEFDVVNLYKTFELFNKEVKIFLKNNMIYEIEEPIIDDTKIEKQTSDVESKLTDKSSSNQIEKGEKTSDNETKQVR